MNTLQLLRKLVPIHREQQLRRVFTKLVRVKQKSPATNIYHCCVWKTASQWIRNVFSATSVYQNSGLLPFHVDSFRDDGVDERDIRDRDYPDAFPENTIVSPLYCNYESFCRLPKPEAWRGFFVCRDPRDIVVSHYFSTRYSHIPNPGVLKMREALNGKSDHEGLLWQIEFMQSSGIFDALHSWSRASSDNSNIVLMRFEDLVGDQQIEVFQRLFDHCGIPMPTESLQKVLSRLSFEKLSGGRKPGTVNKMHKYRSGRPGDWIQHFDEEISGLFTEKSGDLVKALGYDGLPVRPDKQVLPGHGAR